MKRVLCYDVIISEIKRVLCYDVIISEMQRVLCHVHSVARQFVMLAWEDRLHIDVTEIYCNMYFIPL